MLEHCPTIVLCTFCLKIILERLTIFLYYKLYCCTTPVVQFPARCAQDKAQDTRQDKTRQDSKRHDKTRQGKTRQYKTDKTRQTRHKDNNKTRTRQKCIYSSPSYLLHLKWVHKHLIVLEIGIVSVEAFFSGLLLTQGFAALWVDKRLSAHIKREYTVPTFFRVLWYYGGYCGSTRGYYGVDGYYGYCGTREDTTVVPVGTTVL